MLAIAFRSSVPVNLFQDEDVVRKVISYKHPELVMRLRDKLTLSAQDAERLFEDTKQFLTVSALRGGNYSPTKVIDYAWHHFMMYTRDYSQFCEDCFGKMVHHQPDSYFSSTKRPVLKVKADKFARQLFGKLSSNWKSVSGTSTHCCNGGSCTSCESSQ